MAEERIDIEITDKVSPAPAKKLREIAAEALKADSALDRLRASLADVDATALNRLATASAKLTNAQARETSAAARLESARAKMTATTARAAINEQRLATEKARTEAATQRAATATAQAAAAAARAESAALRLANAKARESAATAAATGATQANTAALRANGAAARLAGHQTQNLVYQVNDVVVGLASGQAPLTVLLQQGSQIATVFGPGTGVTGIMRGLGQAVFSIARQFAPVLVVAGAVAGVFGILTHEINKTTDVGVTMGDTFKATFQLIGEAVYEFIQPAITAIAPWVKSAYDFIIDATKFVVNNVIAYYVALYQSARIVFNNIPAAFEAAWKTGLNLVLDAVGFAVNGIIDTFSGTINTTVGIFKGGFDAVVAVWGLLPAAFQRLGALAMNGLIDIVESGVQGIISAIDELLTFIGSAAELVGRQNPFADLLDASSINLDQYKAEVGEPIGEQMATAISDSFTNALNQNYAEGLRGALDVSQYRQELSTAAQDTASAIADAYQTAFSTDYAGAAFNAIRERAIQNARARIAAEAEEENATRSSNRQLSRKEELLQEIQKPLTEYRTDVAALTELLSEGAISLGQFNEALASLSLVSSLRDLDSSLQGTPFADAAAIDEIRIAEQERLNIVQQALEARIISEEEAAARVVEINRQAAMDIQAIEAERNSMILQNAQSTFASLADAAKGFAGEQSGIYKALFITSKAFAIADSIIKIQQGIANALSLPFPANLAAAATVAAQAANIVASIQAVQFADGGKVTGPGGPRDDKILARVSNGEYVVNAAATRRNLPLLEAINSGRDQIRYKGHAYADGGQVSPAFRADDMPRVGNTPQVNVNNNPTIRIFTRDPGTRVEYTATQQDAATARRVSRGQRNL